MAVYRTVTANATLSDNTVQAEGTVSDETARVTAVSQSVRTVLSSDYGDLTNKPKINSHILEGDKSSADLGLASADLVGDLKSDFNTLAYANVNLFDKTTATTGKILSGGAEVTSVNGFYSDYIPITAGTFLVPKGDSTGVAQLQLYRSDKTYISELSPTDLGNGLLKYTINSAIVGYIRFNNDKRQLNTIMFVKGDAYPEVYVPFESARLKNDIILSETQQNYVDGEIETIAIDLPNMFDRDSNNLLNGYFSSGFQSNANYRMTHPIFVKNGETYKYPQSQNLGANYQVAKLDSEMAFTGGWITGTISDGVVSFTSDADQYVRLNVGVQTQVFNFYCINATEYNGKYEPFGKILNDKAFPNSHFNTPNIFNKRVVFDGDSVCYGVGDSTGGNGYASRIGNANEMVWANVGVSGGTIAVVSGVSHNLCTYIDTIHTNYPTLDYLIFEGGSNDADTLTMDNIGEITASNDFSGSYDTSKFYGAVETLFYKALSYYPTAKIGFIIPTKMAIWYNGEWLLPERRTNFFEAIINCCKKWGVPYIDLWHETEMNPCLEAYYDRTMTSAENLAAGKMYFDHQHPNANGYDYIYPTIARWMNTL